MALEQARGVGGPAPLPGGSCEAVHAAYEGYQDRRDHLYPDSGSAAFSADGALVWTHVRGTPGARAHGYRQPGRTTPNPTRPDPQADQRA
ncbi:hypothetical protein [Streptomyces sp. NBC_01565]|uniref:hypothetical protein n=1 Tax=Streptomyces sp. NBC_01565 TaxID=2975881 RepID=UPI0022582DD2|nr:hypothetical protein [Streptomyces sp. NBC_01565]MCX4542177.1 hypothetical protein [Streptomyces sp. NBC_01565]